MLHPAHQALIRRLRQSRRWAAAEAAVSSLAASLAAAAAAQAGLIPTEALEHLGKASVAELRAMERPAVLTPQQAEAEQVRWAEITRRNREAREAQVFPTTSRARARPMQEAEAAAAIPRAIALAGLEAPAEAEVGPIMLRVKTALLTLAVAVAAQAAQTAGLAGLAGRELWLSDFLPRLLQLSALA